MDIAQAGHDHLHLIFGTRWDPMKWRDDLAWLATRPLAELTLVLDAVLADQWVQERPGVANPGYIRKHWPRFASGSTAPRRGAPRPVSSAADFNAEPDDFEAIQAAARAREAAAHG
ncbi:MAG TPA: hypothetical protein VK509_14725 [Polyangiales bacterium]|nr:hypothetical protein [Polyangiales bacterium]